ncbi:MAG: hypothetical protein B5M51_01705 [Anaerolinea sp. 4484_236]|nr:MAG: hypothetical protein B5M51_01705 [Anaerolinea sp. 4484_236]
MRILHLLHQYLPDYVGGTELYTQAIAQGLAKRGHQVGIFYRRSAQGVGVSARTEGAVRVWAAWDGVVTPQRRFWATFRRESSLNSAFERVLDEMRPDLIHLQHLMGLPVRLLSAIRQRDIPFVVTLHDYWWVCANAQLLTNYSHEICEGPQVYINCARCALARAGHSQIWLLWPPLMILLAGRNLLLRRILYKAELLIVPSNFVRDWYLLHGAPANRITVLPHGIELPVKRSRREVSGVQPVQFAYIGGLSWQKGVHVVVEAFRGMQGNAELWIAGDEVANPGYVRQLQADPVPNIHFLGRLTHAQVWDKLAQVDVLLVPSLWYETFSLIVREAFALGVPVIAAAHGALAEAVTDGVDGLLVPPGDVLAWRTAIQRIIRKPGLLTHLKNGITIPLSMERHIDNLEKVYNC